jgi:hypothetical protein
MLNPTTGPNNANYTRCLQVFIVVCLPLLKDGISRPTSRCRLVANVPYACDRTGATPSYATLPCSSVGLFISAASLIACSPQTREDLDRQGVELVAPYRTKRDDPHPRKSAYLSRLRYRIDTVFSQLAGRYRIKRVWAHDRWHLASRLLRKVLSYTVAFVLNH